MFVLIFDDEFFWIRDDRLWRDDVYGSNLLDLGFVYFRGIVGSPLIQSLMSLLAKLLILRMECVFVALRLYMQLDEVDLIVMRQFVVSILSNTMIRDNLW